MPDPMSVEHSFDHIPDEFINWKGDTAATPNVRVRRVTEVVSYAQALHIELDHLRSQLADRDAQVTRMCGELGTACSPPSAKETQDALDELMELVPHDDDCLNDTLEPSLCDGTCRREEAEWKLDTLICRLATGNAERLAAAEAVCEWAKHEKVQFCARDRGEACDCGLADALDKWHALCGGANDAS